LLKKKSVASSSWPWQQLLAVVWQCTLTMWPNPNASACSFGWWLVLICFERKIMFTGSWWLVVLRGKHY
jgi:hypothetical protein